jgi:hypothetical protein
MINTCLLSFIRCPYLGRRVIVRDPGWLVASGVNIGGKEWASEVRKWALETE